MPQPYQNEPNHSNADDDEIEVTILPPKAEQNQSEGSSSKTTETPSLFSFAKLLGDATQVITGTALQTGVAIASTALEVGEAAAKQTHNLISQATQNAGEAVNYVGDIWLVRKVSGFLNLEWLVGATDNLDLENAAAAVKKLQQAYPHESPSEIAHRIMVEKATYAGGIGLASSVVPGAALALLAVDLAATTRLQTEMVYQIAAAYNLDLKDPARKGEVLAIFGLALGGSRVLKAAGLGLLRNIPFAGAMIGASSNAVMLYSLGYAACRFYEAKLDANTSVTSEATITDLQRQSEQYLETAIAQQAVMDQILVHMILAAYPNKTWESILPELQALKLSPTSLDVIANHIKSPQPLETLLNQLTADFAIPLVAQCYAIARADNTITPAEQNVLNAIAIKFNLDLDAIKVTVNSQYTHPN